MATRNSSHQRRHELMPVAGLRKRKDRDVFDAQRGATVTTKPEPAQAPAPFPGGGNRLLAGYLAHEFITRGTLFGRRWDPAAKPAPAAGRREYCPPALPPKPQQQKPGGRPETKQGKAPAAYAELAYLLKTDAAHIPGVVNPTQLARLLQM